MRAPYILAIVLLTIHATPLHAQAKKNCPPGQIFVANACKPCPAGTYRVTNTTNVCVKCPTGTFNPIEGVGSRRLCRFCDQNKFTNKEGSTRCKRCPEGTVAERGDSRCRACGPGFRLFFGRCERCPKSTYNGKNASLECTSCPFPLASPKQSTSRSACKPCPPGQFSSSEIGCIPCLEGTFNPGMKGGKCRDCPPGSVAKPGSAACKQCPAGTFSRNEFEEKCKPCPEGTESNGPGATRCRAIGSTRCPSDTFENANGDCDRCRNGFRYNKEKKVCEKCPSGSVSKGGLQRDCIKCPPGQIADVDFGVGCKCPKGMFRVKKECKPCPRGTGGNFVNVAGKSGCITCEPGFFSDKPGSKRCKQCRSGTFSEGGAKRCKRCPRGFVVNRVSLSAFGGSTRCVSITTGCPFGLQPMRDDFGDISCKRVFCPVGTPEKDIGIKCLPCQPGFRLVGDKCKRCPIDSVSDGGVITSCTKCENGLFRSFFDDSKCSCDGDPGTGKGIQDGMCKDCPPGSLGDPNHPECMKCRPGWFASGFGNEFCTRCPKGTFSDVSGTASCKTCPTGQIPEKATGSKECVPTT